MRVAGKLCIILMLVSLIASAKKRDPLTEAEADQLREVAMEPQKRLLLLIKFTEARLTAIDQVRADPKPAAGRSKRIHDLLEDFTSLLDEINDNLDQYQGRPLDKDDRKAFRKGLIDVIAATERFEVKIRALKSAADTDPQTKKEAADFRFVLQDAADALQSTSDVAREYLQSNESKDSSKKP